MHVPPRRCRKQNLIRPHHTFNCRSRAQSAFEGLFRNPYLWLASGIVVRLQLLALETPFLERILGLIQPNGADGLVFAIAIVAPVAIVEIQKALSRPLPGKPPSRRQGRKTKARSSTRVIDGRKTSSIGTASITASYDVTRTANLSVYPCSGFPAPPPTLGNDESVWFDDALPPSGIDHPWVWSTAYFASGTKSHEEPAATGAHGHYFYYASTGMTAAAHELITTWVLLDPCNPPREIELNWENNRGSWEYRAYWGENLISGGTTDTPSRRYIGPLPPAGVWTRLDVPASIVSLTGANITGENFILYDGHAWFDRAAKASCSFATAAAPSSLPSTDRIWFDDTLPADAVTTNWNWDTTQRASGSQSHTNPLGTDPYIQHYFTDATATMTAGTGETFFAYVLLDPCTTPGEIMLQFYANGSWEHRAFWGGDEIAAASKTRIGDRPPSGQWVRLEVPASAVGLENVPVTGMAFTSTYGTVWWDRVGVAPVTTGSLLLNDNPSMASSMESLAPAPKPAPKLSIGQRLRRWLDTHILHRGRPPASFSIGALLLADTVTTKQHYSLYTPELSLMSETATSTATNPPIAYDYVWFNGEPLAQIENATGAIHWYFDDHLGVPLLTTDATGAVDWRVEREPYGATYVRAGGARHQPLGLPGQEDDESAERQYNIFRWYRAGWGRYTQADPLAHTPRLFLSEPKPHLYGYGANDPLLFTDVTGLCSGCSACPSGEWTVDPFGWGASAAAIGGVTYTRAKYTCRDNGFSVKIETSCFIYGPIVGAGLGVTAPGKACGCSVDDLTSGGDFTKGKTFWFGPINVDTSKCGASTATSGGFSKSWGAGAGTTICTSSVMN